MYRKLLYLILAMLFSFSSTSLTQQAVAMPKASAPANAPTGSGTIVETMNASGYTYMLIENGDINTWVAIPATTVEKGAKISYYEGMVMNNFTSKTLNRTFDSVIFSSGLADQKAAAADVPAANDSFSAAVKAEKGGVNPDPSMSTSPGSAGAVAPLAEVSIEKASGANGYTVEEIFAKSKELNGKKVQIHGKVVKFSPMIMGKNWIHLQDGTGNPMQNSHDLVVTTSETVELDKIITIEGTLAAEKDFGAGYKYAAIVEDATIIK
ncbi:MAG: DNA-binding protein [Desulforhopalus sp.]